MLLIDCNKFGVVVYLFAFFETSHKFTVGGMPFSLQICVPIIKSEFTLRILKVKLFQCYLSTLCIQLWLNFTVVCSVACQKF